MAVPNSHDPAATDYLRRSSNDFEDRKSPVWLFTAVTKLYTMRLITIGLASLHRGGLYCARMFRFMARPHAKL